jgi:hypothetical protein
MPPNPAEGHFGAFFEAGAGQPVAANNAATQATAAALIKASQPH